MTHEGQDQRTAEGRLEAEASGLSRGIVGELWDFLRENQKWWLLPILLVLLLVGVVVILGATGAAPFIYTLF